MEAAYGVRLRYVIANGEAARWRAAAAAVPTPGVVWGAVKGGYKDKNDGTKRDWITRDTKPETEFASFEARREQNGAQSDAVIQRRANEIERRLR